MSLLSSPMSRSSTYPAARIDIGNMTKVIADIERAKNNYREGDEPEVGYTQLMQRIGQCWNDLLDHQQTLLSQFKCELEFNNATKSYQRILESGRDLQEIAKAVMKLCCNITLAKTRKDESTKGQTSIRALAEKTQNWSIRRESNYGSNFDFNPQPKPKIEIFSETYTHPALQEVISDLFQRFTETRFCSREAPKTASNLVPPLCIWNTDLGGEPYYVYPSAENMDRYKLKAAVVSLPAYLMKGGVAAWGALGHEVVGHEILHSHEGLMEELKDKLIKDLTNFGKNQNHSSKGIEWAVKYWSKRVDETASDVLGILHLGPAAALGMLAYFRSLNSDHKMRTTAEDEDEHPLDLLRGYLAVEVMRLLNFSQSRDWADVFESELEKDQDPNVTTRASMPAVLIERYTINIAWIRDYIKVVAKTIACSKLTSLGGESLLELNSWSDQDEKLSQSYQRLFREKTEAEELPRFPEGLYAGHVVSAAIVESFKLGSDPVKMFKMMIGALRSMHLTNPLWQKCATCVS